MNDIIDELRAMNLDRFGSIELPDEDQLVEIEEELLIGIPPDFKEYLLEASDVVVGTLTPVTVTDPHAHTHLPEVTATAWSIGLPRDVIPVCETPEGYYAMSSEGVISFWERETEEFGEQEWENIWDWVEKVWMQS
ncbi:SMI1/KNR4 family protein [Neptunomonas phycophila]|uniref:SMI1/KNR4 family protein n=1 Tax=Neptunomonas phycophila TaxID=1572645 RepID=A0AAW7XKI1_9GAMM|nr:SMI1/KNR4 family protein [Neptunomonas phycophila]MBT3144822.1 SMI1/KNR4 family protein [Neptunomonas phycophila]MDO6454137.1 SMI1/KNR4 family protein [Neptunomonas phycophila]